MSEEDVLLAISSLNSSSKSDSEGFSQLFFKHCSNAIVTPIKLLFQECLNKGVFLNQWKLCTIVPVFKSGDRNDVCNYRPIVKQSTLAKLFDHIIQAKLFDHVNNVISKFQHGFFPGRSTCTNLALLTNQVITAFESRAQLDVIYTDFSKAFDKVDHFILLKKLECHGVSGKLLDFFASFLTQRKLFVKIGCATSRVIVDAVSGIPQGTHCGPLLFLLFINDLPNCFKFTNCLLFADDVKLFSVVRDYSDSCKVQQDLDALAQWCSLNRLELNLNKCFVLTFSRKAMNTIVYNYELNNCAISRCNEMKDLGVIFDSKLTFSKHVDYIVSKAFAMIGFIRRNTSEFKDPFTLKSLYISLVRSRLEYCSLIWSPYYDIHSNRIERVQKCLQRSLCVSYRGIVSFPLMLGGESY